MSTVVKDLGAVSAYAYAVEKGYTGTEAEFAKLMADYAEVGQRAEDAAESALNSKTAAQAAATTATNKASEATTAAQTATTKAGEAQTSAQTASSKASEASQSASQASGYAQTAETAKTYAQTAKTQAETARDEAVTAKTAAETAQGKAEDAQAAAESVAESIPSDYSQLSEDVSDLKEELNNKTTFIESYVITDVSANMPSYALGNHRFVKNTDDDMMISGSYNAAELLNIKQGTFTVNGVTITVDGCMVTMNGQPTADFNYSFVDGDKKTSSELMAMTLPVPTHLYTASQKVISGSVFPSVLCRGKVSGNAFVVQNNTAVFTMDASICGGLYAYMQASKTYNCSFVLALLPYSTDNNNPHREDTSSITVYNANGIYDLDGYTWIVGNPTVTYLASKLPKKPICKYSTRIIDYSSMVECLDVYIPAKIGYVNYIFGHTRNTDVKGDVWRLVQIDAVSDAFGYRYHITQLGETEMAIMISGRDDFIGGTTHGDEVMDASSLLFVIDGKPVDITTVTELTEFETLQCFVVSTMYDPSDHTTEVGKHGREWRFDKDGLCIGQTVEFLETLSLSSSYMPMLCVLRGNDTASALQVTDTYIDDGNYQQYDVSVGGFTTYPNRLKKDVREIHLTGKISGIEVTFQIIEQPEGLNGAGTFLYNGANTYNKVYSTICGYGGGSQQSVANGDKWKIKSQINIDIGL